MRLFRPSPTASASSWFPRDQRGEASPPDGKTPPPDGKTPPPDGKTPPPDGKTLPPDGKIPSPDSNPPAPDLGCQVPAPPAFTVRPAPVLSPVASASFHGADNIYAADVDPPDDGERR